MRIRMLADSATVPVGGRSCTVKLHAPEGGGYVLGIAQFADEAGWWGIMDGLEPERAQKAWREGFDLRPAPVLQAIAQALVATGAAEIVDDLLHHKVTKSTK